MAEARELVVIRDGEAQVAKDPDDLALAVEIQMQELLFLQSQNLLETPQALQGSSTPIEEVEPIDPKGKRPAEFNLGYFTIERGESSRAIHDMFYCYICMEQVPTIDGFNIDPCNDIFCISCMISYITAKLEENVISIPCPKPGCESASLDPATWQHILPTATFDRWCLALCESSLGLKKFYCPFKDCSALLIDEEEGKIMDCECPHCNRLFCARCKVPWHGDMTCEEFERLGKDERGREDLMLRNLANDKRWQRCPKCRMYVEKIDGCLFMKCRCGYFFCYDCASPMSVESHYCKNCKRTY